MSETILEEVAKVLRDRREQYGQPYDECKLVSRFWTIAAGTHISPEKVALMMALLKIAREINQHKRDNLVDGIGYLQCVQDVIEQGVIRRAAESGDLNESRPVCPA